MRATLAVSLALAAVALPGCSIGPDASFPADSSGHAALAVPPAFEPADSARAEAGRCLSPLIDPRDETELRLVRSSGGRGDYLPPAGRYGVAADELLRIDCSSGRPVGVVRR